MLLREILEATTDLFSEVVSLLNQLTADDFEKDAFREQEQTRVGEDFVQRVAQEYPQLIYQGSMFRTVSVEGLEPLTLEQIRQHALGAGLQSFSKTEEGMQAWLEEVYQTIDIQQADTYLQQQGTGIDVLRVVEFIYHNNLERRFKSAMFNLERAADVEEVVAPYNQSLRVTGTELWNEDWDNEDEDW